MYLNIDQSNKIKLKKKEYTEELNKKIFAATAAAAKSLQSCPTLCDPIDGSPPDFPAPGILQARTVARTVKVPSPI